MRAFIVPKFGEPGEVGERPTPAPAGDELLVRVTAAGVNPMEVAVRAGYMKDFLEHRFPLTPGSEYAGTVVEVGSDVTGFQVGDEVFGSAGKAHLGDGSFAEYVAVKAGLASIRPAQLEPQLAAVLPVAAATALAALDALDVNAGETIGVIGAAGGVGSFTILLAAKRGVNVIAATRPENADYVRSLGAASVVDSTADLASELRRLAPDGLAGMVDTFHSAQDVLPLAEAVRSGGVIASPVAMGIDQVLAGQSVRGTTVSAARERIGELGQWAATGSLTPLKMETVPLADAADALDRLASRTVRGKLVIEIEPIG